MIEATCSACGTLNRVPEASVPVGAKFVTCIDCKSRIALPSAAAVPPLPKLPPASPRPPIVVPPPSAQTSDVIDLADLPAPKRASALGPAPKPPARTAIPAMRSGLAAALDPELPAPKAMRAQPAPTLDLDDLLAPEAAARVDSGLAGRDLPPTGSAAEWRRGSSDGGGLPPTGSAAEWRRGSSDGGIDLPAPKKPAARTLEPLRPAEAATRTIETPRPPREELADLPAPKLARSAADLSVPRAAPKRPAAPPPISDLPAPKRGPTIAELPTPRSQDLQPKAAGHADLPAPKGFFDDLPQPALDHDRDRGEQRLDPRADLPAPKGFFDDLPQPALDHDRDRGEQHLDPRADLPAPKGFFDDLPQPKSNPSGGADVVAPKGYYDDIPGLPLTSKPEVPAPKGYFENIPALPHTSKPEVPAPKGFFENIPALPHTSKPEVPAPKGFFDDIPGLPHTAKPEVPAPKGFFENVPGRPIKKTDGLAPRGFFDDLPQPSHDPDAPPVLEDELELDAGPELDLLPPSSAPDGTFDDLDLSQPSAPPVRFEPPRLQPVRPAEPPRAPTHDDSLTLEIEGAKPTVATPKIGAKPAARAKPAEPEDTVATAATRARRRKLALGGVAVLAVLGGAGYVLYQRHAAAQAREAEIAAQLAIARAAYAASDPKHWQRAANAARQVVELDDHNVLALGIGAESLLASALADGTAAATKISQARAMLDTANNAGISSPILGRARALGQIAVHQPDGAINLLQALSKASPKDPALALYLGWALDAHGDPTAAIAAYDLAASDPAVKVSALYGRGSAKLELTDLDGARADFAAVLELVADHIGAQVGLAAAEPPSEAQQQEADLTAILARKDVATADPRAIAQAWTLAGVAAQRAGRSEVARERFHKALAVVPNDLGATTGLAETELRDGKLAAAAELTAAALGISKDNVPAQLVQSEIELKQNKLPLAGQRLAALASHTTPLAPLEQARLHLITGKLFEAQGKDDDAIDAYVAGARAAHGLDLAPTMAAVAKLATMAAAAVAARDPARAGELRARSEQVLGELAEQAERDPRLAMTLGVAYLQEGNAEKAEPWLRRVVEARPADAEARFQLGRALLKSGQHAAALEALNAAMGLDPSRSDIAVDLARTYEALGQDGEARTLYGKLLGGNDPTLELRARAGRFYARTGAIDKAGEQGAKIVAVDPSNPAGFYLKGEALLAAGKALEAKQAFLRASDLDRDPQYLDAVGRAAEVLGQGGDREQQDLALRSYAAAAEGTPAPPNAFIGQGRLYVARHEAAKAVPALIAASRLDPNNAEVMSLMGAAYQELQQPAVALQWFEASTRIAPSAEAFWRMGQLYRDGNAAAMAAAALGSATRLASESEKKSGKPVVWLTDALYLLGRVQLDLHNEAAARDAWSIYVGRTPTPSAQLTEVKQLLATSLRR
jgi:tetratricopeptide (TPR) repeat protein